MEAFGFLQALHRELGPTTLLVTHNVALAERCDRTVRLGAMPMLGATSSGS
jgi:predicted ABC-type transport system involved in lysophospholipase L1 biosynthesis ATPase subunit